MYFMILLVFSSFRFGRMRFDILKFFTFLSRCLGSDRNIRYICKTVVRIAASRTGKAVAASAESSGVGFRISFDPVLLIMNHSFNH